MTDPVSVATLPVQLAPALLPVLDVIGIAVFALSGALAAAKRNQTLVTFTFFAVATGVGGGTVRDLLIGAPVFWVQASWVPLVCLAMALMVWVTPDRWWVDVGGESKALDWADAVGLASYAVFGTAKALAYQVDPLPAAMMGVITACVGGIIRDMLAHQPSIIMRPEIYVTAAALSAGSFVLLLMAGTSFWLAASIAAIAGFSLRALAIYKGIALPTYETMNNPPEE